MVSQLNAKEREKYLRSARRGARFLDRMVPGWRKMIRLTRLEMTDPIYYVDEPGECGCVLAQLDAYIEDSERGSYERMRNRLGLTKHPIIDRAFDGDMPTSVMRQVIREGR